MLSHSTLSDLMDCSPPGPSVHGTSQGRILEWVAVPSSRGSSRPKDRTQVSCMFCTEPRGKAGWVAPNSQTAQTFCLCDPPHSRGPLKHKHLGGSPPLHRGPHHAPPLQEVHGCPARTQGSLRRALRWSVAVTNISQTHRDVRGTSRCLPVPRREGMGVDSYWTPMTPVLG